MSAYLRWLIALAPVFPPLTSLVFAALRYWRRLGGPAQAVIALFLASQLLAALLTPNPLLSLALAALRGLFVVSLLLLGVFLRDQSWLRYLLFGAAVVSLTALLSSYAAYGPHFYARRLIHPYYTTSALGVTAAITIWLVLDWERASPWLRSLLGLLGLAVLMLSGSRGAILALGTGALAAALVGGRSFLLAIGAGVFFLAARYVQLWKAGWAAEFHRMFSLNPSGRNEVWQRAWEAFSSHPWGGVGPYQLGPWLEPGAQIPARWQQLLPAGLHLPGWTASLAGFWLLAHNVFLHSLAETGLIGTAGYLALLVFVGYAVLRARQPLLAAIYFGMLAMSLVDNPITVPSLFFAEVFWVAGGMALAQAGLAVPLEQGLAVDQDQLGPDAL